MAAQLTPEQDHGQRHRAVRVHDLHRASLLRRECRAQCLVPTHDLA
jgi:hypothetical protein